MANAAKNAEFYRESADRLDALWHDLVAMPAFDESLTLALTAGIQSLRAEARAWDRIANDPLFAEVAR